MGWKKRQILWKSLAISNTIILLLVLIINYINQWRWWLHAYQMTNYSIEIPLPSVYRPGSWIPYQHLYTSEVTPCLNVAQSFDRGCSLDLIMHELNEVWWSAPVGLDCNEANRFSTLGHQPMLRYIPSYIVQIPDDYSYYLFINRKYNIFTWLQRNANVNTYFCVNTVY